MNRGQRSPVGFYVLCWVALAAMGCERDKKEGEPTTRTAERPAEQKQTERPHAQLFDVDDPAQCAGCHAEIVAQWRSSMHAHSHHSQDPIFDAMRSLRMKREGAKLAGRCAQCHGPRDPGDPESRVSKVGVGCASCHLVDNLDRAGGKKKGAQALSFSESTMRGPHDIEIAPAAPHGVGKAAPFIKDGKNLCLACHDAMRNPQGAATCTTGTEYAAGQAEKSCAECHMPTVERPNGAASQRKSHASHRFLGPHALFGDERQKDFMASAIEMTGEVKKHDLELNLQNEAGHSVPSGFPGRVVLIKMVGFDASKNPVWSNWSDDPMKEDPDAVLNKVYVDTAGNPTMPPYSARLERDNRLAPGEQRKLTWKLPPVVERVEVQLLYRLLSPGAVKGLGLSDSRLAEAQPFARLTLRRP